MADEAPPLRSPLEQAQRALGTVGLRLEVVQALFRLSIEWLDERELLTRALHILESKLHAEAGSVIMLDRSAGDLYFAAATGPVATDLETIRFDRSEGIAGWCIESNQVVRVTDVAAEQRWHSDISRSLGFDVRQILAAPFTVRNRIIGCVELINHRGGGEFESDDEEVMRDAAECIGMLFALRGRRAAP